MFGLFFKIEVWVRILARDLVGVGNWIGNAYPIFLFALAVMQLWAVCH